MTDQAIVMLAGASLVLSLTVGLFRWMARNPAGTAGEGRDGKLFNQWR